MAASPIRVVLVEDDAPLRAAFALGLENDARIALVGSVGDGRSGLVAVGASAPDVLVLDLGLPDMSGEEILARVREQAPGALILAVSGRETACGADAQLLKPVGLAELVEAVCDLAG